MLVQDRKDNAKRTIDTVASSPQPSLSRMIERFQDVTRTWDRSRIEQAQKQRTEFERTVRANRDLVAAIRTARSEADANGDELALVAIPSSLTDTVLAQFTGGSISVHPIDKQRSALLLQGACVANLQQGLDSLGYSPDALAPGIDWASYPSPWHSALEVERSYSPVVAIEELCFRPSPWWKRILDTVLAACLLMFLAPLFLVVACLIKLTSPGPVFFRQRRLGGSGRPFTIWKFRTLHTGETQKSHQDYVSQLTESNSQLKKLDHSGKMIPCGKLLRAACIDELPQLLNVLNGTMSLVGPRPDVVPFEKYQPHHRHRFDVVPGMTGLWQVSGKNRTTFEQMIQFDVVYTRTRSLFLDLWIMGMTIPAMVRQAMEETNI